MSDQWWTHKRKREAVETAEKEGDIADNIDYRKSLVQKMNSGEMTLEEVQAELAKTKRDAGKNGKRTRTQAYREG